MSADAAARVGGSGQRRGSRRPALLLVLLVVGLFVVALLGAPAQSLPTYDPRSTLPDGTRALFLWLQEMGYRTGELERDRFALPPEADALLVFPGVLEYAPEDARALLRWAEQGKTVALVDLFDSGLASVLLDHDPRSVGPQGWVTQVQPLLPETETRWSPFSGSTTFSGSTALRAPVAGSGAVPVLALPDGEATLAVKQRGEGTLWYVTSAHAPTNETLRDPNQAAIVAAILRTVPEGGAIFFDAYHFYGPQAEPGRIETLQDFVYGTAIGQALLFATAAWAIYWLLAGRRLGPPLPARGEVHRREAAEYVRAMAGLKRRARSAPDVAAHHRQRLKSALARTRALDPRLDDAAYVQRLRAHATVDGSLDAAALAQVEQMLAALHAPKDEQALVEAAAAVDTFLAGHR